MRLRHRTGRARGFPSNSSPGNHESNGLNGNINDFSACLPNQLPGLVGTYGRQYYVDVPQGAPLVRFIAISPNLVFPDSTWSYAAGTPRYQWTAAAIDGARAANIPWVVVGVHKPCISLGQYACDVGADITNLCCRSASISCSTATSTSTSGASNWPYARAAPLWCRVRTTARASPTPTATWPGRRDGVRDGGHRRYRTPRRDGDGPRSRVLRGVVGPELEPDVGKHRRLCHGGPTDGTVPSRDRRQLHRQLHHLGGRPANASPVAAFTPTCTALACTVDGSASTDSDGTITGYAWDFGDGATVDRRERDAHVRGRGKLPDRPHGDGR